MKASEGNDSGFFFFKFSSGRNLKAKVISLYHSILCTPCANHRLEGAAHVLKTIYLTFSFTAEHLGRLKKTKKQNKKKTSRTKHVFF